MLMYNRHFTMEFCQEFAMDGKEYFYVNPLADRGGHRRQRWFACACCPPNVARTITSIPGYMYSISQREYGSISMPAMCLNLILSGSKVAIGEKTDYPWEDW